LLLLIEMNYKEKADKKNEKKFALILTLFYEYSSYVKYFLSSIVKRF